MRFIQEFPPCCSYYLWLRQIDVPLSGPCHPPPRSPTAFPPALGDAGNPQRGRGGWGGKETGVRKTRPPMPRECVSYRRRPEGPLRMQRLTKTPRGLPPEGAASPHARFSVTQPPNPQARAHGTRVQTPQRHGAQDTQSSCWRAHLPQRRGAFPRHSPVFVWWPVLCER